MSKFPLPAVDRRMFLKAGAGALVTTMAIPSLAFAETPEIQGHSSLGLPSTDELKPKIIVAGVGRGGIITVNQMISKGLQGVDFAVVDTDASSLISARTNRRIQLGGETTSSGRPKIHPQSIEEIRSVIDGANLLFITAGMGRGTGPWAAPAIGNMAREMGILTIGAVGLPFVREDTGLIISSGSGIHDLRLTVDTLFVHPLQSRINGAHGTSATVFSLADEEVYWSVRCISDLMVVSGLIGLDFDDIRTVLELPGKATWGRGVSEGGNRVVDAAEAAVSAAKFSNVRLKEAKGVLMNVTGGPDMTLYEVDAAAHRIRKEVGADANIVIGSTFDAAMENRILVSLVATGIAGVGDQTVAAETRLTDIGLGLSMAAELVGN